ncbi:MAG TPA: NUDIX hydrolase [Thermoanaerobaculia bacterium]|nr:NUDIX hydrolase [Thermoanaerobaculia bacterium]
MADEREVVFEGRHMVFLRRRGWEYVEHRTAPEAAMIVAITPRDEIVLAEEFRQPMNAPVISLPAGLVGDEGPEDAAEAARRELAEETGHTASRLELLARGPGSAGQSSEMISFFLAAGAVRSGEQAAHDVGKIRVHVVSIADLPEWARRREAEGAVIDPKIWAGLYLAGRR